MEFSFKTFMTIIAIVALALASAFIAIPDRDAEAAQTSATSDVMAGSLQIKDDQYLYFGNGNDIQCRYDEAGDDRLECSGAVAFTTTTSDVDFMGGVAIPDDKALTFGSDGDASFVFDESGDDVLKIVGTVWFMEGSDPTVFAGPVFMQNSGAVADDETFGFGDDGDWVCGYDETTSDDLQCTALAGASLYNVLVGNLAVGNGTPDVVQNGEDGYVEGTFEVDGAARFDGAIDANGAVDVAGALTVTAPGWTAASGANTACTTTCGIATAIIGFDAGGSTFVAPDAATADTCLCDGATS